MTCSEILYAVVLVVALHAAIKSMDIAQAVVVVVVNQLLLPMLPLFHDLLLLLNSVGMNNSHSWVSTDILASKQVAMFYSFFLSLCNSS